jgi:hypothetical protein
VKGAAAVPTAESRLVTARALVIVSPRCAAPLRGGRIGTTAFSAGGGFLPDLVLGYVRFTSPREDNNRCERRHRLRGTAP